MKELIVDVIAPASRCPVDDLENVKQFLSSWDLKYQIPKDLFGNHPFCSNIDELRFQQLENALTNTTSNIIWCLRGGYGSMKLIPYLNKIKSPPQKKIFIGSSDITALHIFLQEKWGWDTIHGPSVHAAAMNQISSESLVKLKNLLFKEKNALVYHSIIGLNSAAKKIKHISAPIIGGNLTLVQASLGTSWQINTKNKILFIEEVNERGYRIDRALEQLKQAHGFESAKAVLIGDLIGGEESNGKSLVQDAIQLFANTCSIPVFQISGIGHGEINNPLVLGRAVELKADEQAKTDEFCLNMMI